MLSYSSQFWRLKIGRHIENNPVYNNSGKSILNFYIHLDGVIPRCILSSLTRQIVKRFAKNILNSKIYHWSFVGLLFRRNFLILNLSNDAHFCTALYKFNKSGHMMPIPGFNDRKGRLHSGLRLDLTESMNVLNIQISIHSYTSGQILLF